MQPEILGLMQKIVNAISCVRDLAYYTGKQKTNSELEFAVAELSDLLQRMVSEAGFKRSFFMYDKDHAVDEMATTLARSKLDDRMSLREFQRY